MSYSTEMIQFSCIYKYININYINPYIKDIEVFSPNEERRAILSITDGLVDVRRLYTYINIQIIKVEVQLFQELLHRSHRIDSCLCCVQNDFIASCHKHAGVLVIINIIINVFRIEYFHFLVHFQF
jgi:hypothetical protein